MKKSILTDDMESCYLCGADREAVHHVFYGTALRKISDKNGFIVPLCARCHNMSDNAVHFNKAKDLALKQACQREYEKSHTHEEFMALIGRNYL